MSVELDITGRDARDRLALLLGLGVPHPLRDLDLSYPEMVAQGMTPGVSILQAQQGVLYQLCDDDGNPVAGVGPVQGDSSGAAAVLQVPAITEDIDRTVLASRSRGDTVLESYLSQPVSFKAGINTKLVLRFDPVAGQSAAGSSIAVAYGDRVTVVLEASQEGVYYRLVRETPEDPLSPEELLGNQRELRFTTEAPVEEDLVLRIKAHRKVGRLKPALLETRLDVEVRPNPGVEVRPAASIVAYGEGTEIVLASPQASARYRLYRRTITTADYLPAATRDAISVSTGNGSAVLIRAPERVAGGPPPPGFVMVADFNARSGALTAATGPLDEDSLFLVLASKANDQSLVLNAAVAVLVRPSPHPQVVPAASPIDSGSEGLVIVTGAQRGVRYQLLAGGIDLNPPGFHFENRGIESARVGVDLTVGEWGTEPVLLPAGVLQESTAFKVRATKILTGLSAELTGAASIEVNPRPTPPSEPAPAAQPPIATSPGTEAPVAPKPKPKPRPKPKRDDEVAPAEKPGLESGSTAPLPIPTPEPPAPIEAAGGRSMRLAPPTPRTTPSRSRSGGSGSPSRKSRDHASVRKQAKAPRISAKSSARGHHAVSPDQPTPASPARGEAATSRSTQKPKTKKEPMKPRPKTKSASGTVKRTRAGKPSEPQKPKPPFSGLPGLLPPTSPGVPSKPGTPGKPPTKPGKPTKPNQPAKPSGPKGKRRSLPKPRAKRR